MNILLSRILTYLNGTLFHDYNYKICTFIIFHYLEMEDMSEEDFLKKGCFKKEVKCTLCQGQLNKKVYF